MTREDTRVWSVGPDLNFNPPSPDFDTLARHIRCQIMSDFAVSPEKLGSRRSASISNPAQQSPQVLITTSVPLPHFQQTPHQRQFTHRSASPTGVGSSSLRHTRSLAGRRHSTQEVNIFVLVCQQLARCLNGIRTLYGQPISSAQELFNAIDVDHTGDISAAELHAATHRLDLGLMPEQVDAFYQYLGGGKQRISVSILADAVVHHHRTRMLSEENAVLKEYTTSLERERKQVMDALKESSNNSNNNDNNVVLSSSASSPSIQEEQDQEQEQEEENETKEQVVLLEKEIIDLQKAIQDRDEKLKQNQIKHQNISTEIKHELSTVVAELADVKETDQLLLADTQQQLISSKQLTKTLRGQTTQMKKEMIVSSRDLKNTVERLEDENTNNYNAYVQEMEQMEWELARAKENNVDLGKSLADAVTNAENFRRLQEEEEYRYHFELEETRQGNQLHTNELNMEIKEVEKNSALMLDTLKTAHETEMGIIKRVVQQHKTEAKISEEKMKLLVSTHDQDVVKLEETIQENMDTHATRIQLLASTHKEEMEQSAQHNKTVLSSLNTEKITVETMNATLKKDVETLQVTLHEMEQTNEENEQNIEQMNNTNLELVETIQTATLNMGQLAMAKGEAIDQVNELTEEVETLRTELKEMGMTNDAVVQNLNATQLEKTTMDEKNQTLATQVNEQNKRLSSLESIKATNINLSEMLKESTSEVDALKHTIKTSTKCSMTTIEQLNTTILTLTDALAQAEIDIDKQSNKAKEYNAHNETLQEELLSTTMAMTLSQKSAVSTQQEASELECEVQSLTLREGVLEQTLQDTFTIMQELRTTISTYASNNAILVQENEELLVNINNKEKERTEYQTKMQLGEFKYILVKHHIYKRNNDARTDLQRALHIWKYKTSAQTRWCALYKMITSRGTTRELRSSFITWRNSTHQFMAIQTMVETFIIRKEHSMLRKIVMGWYKYTTKQRALVTWGWPLICRYVHRIDLQLLRSSVLTWKKEIDCLKDVERHGVAIRCMARMVYRVYRRRQILDPMNNLFNRWHRFTHEYWPRVARRSLVAMQRVLTSDVYQALQKWKLYTNHLSSHENNQQQLLGMQNEMKKSMEDEMIEMKRLHVLKGRRNIARRYVLRWQHKNISYAFKQWLAVLLNTKQRDHLQQLHGEESRTNLEKKKQIITSNFVKRWKSKSKAMAFRTWYNVNRYEIAKENQLLHDRSVMKSFLKKLKTCKIKMGFQKWNTVCRSMKRLEKKRKYATLRKKHLLMKTINKYTRCCKRKSFEMLLRHQLKRQHQCNLERKSTLFYSIMQRKSNQKQLSSSFVVWTSCIKLKTSQQTHLLKLMSTMKTKLLMRSFYRWQNGHFTTTWMKHAEVNHEKRVLQSAFHRWHRKHTHYAMIKRTLSRWCLFETSKWSSHAKSYALRAWHYATVKDRQASTISKVLPRLHRRLTLSCYIRQWKQMIHARVQIKLRFLHKFNTVINQHHEKYQRRDIQTTFQCWVASTQRKRKVCLTISRYQRMLRKRSFRQWCHYNKQNTTFRCRVTKMFDCLVKIHRRHTNEILSKRFIVLKQKTFGTTLISLNSLLMQLRSRCIYNKRLLVWKKFFNCTRSLLKIKTQWKQVVVHQQRYASAQKRCKLRKYIRGKKVLLRIAWHFELRHCRVRFRQWLKHCTTSKRTEATRAVRRSSLFRVAVVVQRKGKRTLIKQLLINTVRCWYDHTQKLKRVRRVVARKLDQMVRHGVSGSFDLWTHFTRHQRQHEVYVQQRALRVMRHMSRSKKQILTDCYQKWLKFIHKTHQQNQDYSIIIARFVRIMHHVVLKRMDSSFRTWYSHHRNMKEEDLKRKHVKTTVRRVLIRKKKMLMKKGYVIWHKVYLEAIDQEKHNQRIILKTKNMLGRLIHGSKSKTWNTWVSNAKEQIYEKRILRQFITRMKNVMKLKLFTSWALKVQKIQRCTKLIHLIVIKYQKRNLLSSWYIWKINTSNEMQRNMYLIEKVKNNLFLKARSKTFQRWSANVKTIVHERYIVQKFVKRMVYLNVTRCLEQWKSNTKSMLHRKLILKSILSQYWLGRSLRLGYKKWRMYLYALSKERELRLIQRVASVVLDKQKTRAFQGWSYNVRRRRRMNE